MPSANLARVKQKQNIKKLHDNCDLAKLTIEEVKSKESTIRKKAECSLATLVTKKEPGQGVVKIPWSRATAEFDNCFKLVHANADERQSLYSLNVLNSDFSPPLEGRYR